MDLWLTIFRKALDFQPKVSVYLAALSRRVLPNPQDYRMLQATRAVILTCPNAAIMHIRAYMSTLSQSLIIHPGLPRSERRDNRQPEWKCVLTPHRMLLTA